MSDDLSHMDDRTLFGRLELPPASPAQPGETPDALLLAAWLEGRPDTDAAAVEALLAADPALLDDMLALRTPLLAESPAPGFLARVQALVPAEQPGSTAEKGGGVVVPFRPAQVRQAAAPAPSKRLSTAWFAWGAVAASVACIAVVGFNLGTMVEQKLYPATTSTASSADHDSSTLDFLDNAGVSDVVS